MANENEPISGFTAFWSRNSKKIQIGMAIFFVVVLAALGGLWYYNKIVNRDVLAVVGNEKVTKADLNKSAYGMDFSTTNAESLSTDVKATLQAQLVEDAIVRQEAKKLGISISDKEVNTEIAANEDITSNHIYKNYTPDQQAQTREGTRAKLLRDKVLRTEIAWKAGSYFAVNFHKYIADSSYNIPGNGDSKLIAAQKTAAKALAGNLSSGLTSGEITVSQAKEILINDPNVGREAMIPRSPTMGGTFSIDDYMQNNGVLAQSNFLSVVANTKKGSASNPTVQVGKFNDKDQEYRYLVFYVSDSGSGKFKTYQDWLSSKTKEYVKNNSSITSAISKLLLPSIAYAQPGQCDGACSTDNADIWVTTRWHRADNNTNPALGGQSVSIKAGSYTNDGDSTTYYANAPDGSSCKSTTQTVNLTTETSATSHGGVNYSVGNTSMCSSNRSFFCSRQSVAWITLNDYGDLGDSGTEIRDRGNWKWDLDYAHEGMMDSNESSAPSGTDGSDLRTYYSWDGDHDYNDSAETLTNQGTASNPWYRVRISLSASHNIDNNDFNGETVNNSFTWWPHLDVAPTAAYVSPSAGQQFTAATVGGTAPVTLSGSANDSDSDQVAVQVAYREASSSSTSWHTFGSPSRSEGNGPDGAIVSGNYDDNTAVSLYGWLPTNTSRAEINHAKPYTASFPAINLPAGTYEWAVRGRDVEGLFSPWSKDRTFTVVNPTVVTPPPTPTPTPSTVCSDTSFNSFTGSPTTVNVGDVVSFNYSSATAAFNYFIDYGDNTSSVNQPNTATTHSYNASGSKIVKLQCGTPSSPGTIAKTVTITVNASANNAPVVHLDTTNAISPYTGPSPVDGSNIGKLTEITNPILKATVVDPDGDTVKLKLCYYLGSDVAHTTCLDDGILHPSGWSDSKTVSGLAAGTYSWSALGTDSHGLYSAVGATFIVDPLPDNTCTVLPASHDMPSYIHANASTDFGGSGLYNFTTETLDSSGNVAGSTSAPAQVSGQFSETLTVAGNYRIKVSRTGVSAVTCTTGVGSSISVTNPGSGSGGDVSPGSN